MTSEYAICACTAPQCRLRYPASRRDKAYTCCPACGAPVAHQHLLSPREEGGEQPLVEHQALRLGALLDNVRSIHNVGSIFRSADGAGFAQLYLCGVTPTPANPKLAKTALGAHGALAWQWHPNAVDLAKTLRDQGYALWALEEGPAAESLYDAPPPPAQTVLVAGSEVTGVDPALLDLCTRKLAIPMRGVKRSLNVATAFGLAALLLSERMVRASAAGQQV